MSKEIGLILVLHFLDKNSLEELLAAVRTKKAAGKKKSVQKTTTTTTTTTKWNGNCNAFCITH